MYVCMYVCMYVRTYVRMYVCMYVSISHTSQVSTEVFRTSHRPSWSRSVPFNVQVPGPHSAGTSHRLRRSRWPRSKNFMGKPSKKKHQVIILWSLNLPFGNGIYHVSNLSSIIRQAYYMDYLPRLNMKRVWNQRPHCLSLSLSLSLSLFLASFGAHVCSLSFGRSWVGHHSFAMAMCADERANQRSEFMVNLMINPSSPLTHQKWMYKIV